MPANDICLICHKKPKRKEHQFCSDKCTKIAAQRAPELLRVPKGHVLYENVSKQWAEKWHDKTTKPPPIAKLYLVTWTPAMRESFERYRESVAHARNIPKGTAKEVKCFRSERRACDLGDRDGSDLCSNTECRLCMAIRTGFKSSLDFKRRQVFNNSPSGRRFGGGVYMGATSNKAYQYAEDISKGSKYLTVLTTRTVLGNQQYLHEEQHGRMRPDWGYDSVKGRANGGGPLELVVYDEDAVRPAYLIMVKKP